MEALIVALFIVNFLTGIALAYLWKKLFTFCDLYDTVSHNSITNQRYLESKIKELEGKLIPKVSKTSLTQNTNAPIKKNTKPYRKDKS